MAKFSSWIRTRTGILTVLIIFAALVLVITVLGTQQGWLPTPGAAGNNITNSAAYWNCMNPCTFRCGYGPQCKSSCAKSCRSCAVCLNNCTKKEGSKCAAQCANKCN